MVDDNTVKKTTDANTGSSTASQRYLAQIYPYREIILQVSQQFLETSPYELASNHGKLQNYDKQIVDVMRNLENLGRAPPGVKFDKQAVLKALKKAREELGMALYILDNPDREKGSKGIKNLTPCRDYLIVALRYIPAKSG